MQEEDSDKDGEDEDAIVVERGRVHRIGWMDHDLDVLVPAKQVLRRSGSGVAGVELGFRTRGQNVFLSASCWDSMCVFFQSYLFSLRDNGYTRVHGTRIRMVWIECWKTLLVCGSTSLCFCRL